MKTQAYSLQRCVDKSSLLLTKPLSENNFAPAIVHEVLSRPGKSLDTETRLLMQSRFNHDFSSVRVHSDPKAAQSTQAVNAIAYTIGNHIAFDHNQYMPHTETGKKLLAHELAHVVQQKFAPITTQIPIHPTDSRAERQATAAANAHQPFPRLNSTSVSLQRQQAQPRYRQVPGITTPQPANVSVRRGGTTRQTIHGLVVIFQPDRRSRARNMRNRAKTDFNFNRHNINFRSRNGVVSSFTGPGTPRVHIRTTYGRGVTSTSTSGYGRGTTQADIRTGSTSVGFHEGRHGLDYLTFFQQNPFPQFTGRVGMSETDFRAAMQTYRTAKEQYIQNLRQFSERRTDCVGTTIDQYNAQQGIITTTCQAAP